MNEQEYRKLKSYQNVPSSLEGPQAPPEVAILPNALNKLEQVLANLFERIISIETVLQISSPNEGLNPDPTKAVCPSKIQDRASKIDAATEVIALCIIKLQGIEINLQEL